ncbi:MAG: hypothetical protein E6K81_01055 [Candidatus Eisenbacteria bacterium]|uniref:Type II secretion system protein GspF domain-containing protein n=1 Tax=Eiseniibacteriota bacterium TaxID=2212470 RepID=A0A538UE29_UNCEI|nr:MAG: hypothetical protein E6K81_01055 [Candidatus Eisenbacteria bacterium]
MILLSLVLLAAAVAIGVFVALIQTGSTRRELEGRLGRASRHLAPSGPRDVERDQRLSVMPWLDRALRDLRLGERLELMLYQAGMQMRVGALVLLMASGALGAYSLTMLLTHRIVPALMLMALAGPAPYAYVAHRRARRMKAFAAQFPDSLELLVSSLKAGLSFSAAMQIVAEESPEPVRGEFAIAVEEQALGLEFRETMRNLTRRVEVLDLRFFVTAVLLQRDTGGNLAEVLHNTATLIRERFRVLGDIKTFTAQGRMTGAILVCLPVAIALFTYSLTPDYFRPVLESHTGRLLLWGAGGLQILGMVVIRRIVDIKV